MDSRLARTSNQADRESLTAWLNGNRTHLNMVVDVLHEAVADISRDDNLSTFTEPQNALVVLAHRAGRREGLREAIRLLSTR